MSDGDIMAGQWTVTVGRFKWVYICDRNGGVKWHDYNDKTENGIGRWSKAGQEVRFSWTDSTTQRETWTLDDDNINAIGDVVAGWGNYDDLVALKTATSSDANDLMAKWAQALKDKMPFSSPHCCPFAVPYLGLTVPKNSMPRLDKENIGGPMQKVLGLAMHTTAGQDQRSAFQTAAYGCVGTWNTRRRNGELKAVSAHFAVSGDGTLIQIVPTNLIAWAQGDPADPHFISVEIDNNGRQPMKTVQLEIAKRLFNWVCRTYYVPQQLATGLLTPKFKEYDEITMEVCGAAGADVTRDRMVACKSQGLSCHVWLNPKACPGPGILAQMASIVRSGPVS